MQQYGSNSVMSNGPAAIDRAERKDTRERAMVVGMDPEQRMKREDVTIENLQKVALTRQNENLAR